MISLNVVWVFKVCCAGVGCRCVCVCVEGDGRGLNASMSVCVNLGGGLIATKIDSLVEHRKSNTKTDNITSSKPERLTANSIQRHRLQNYWHIYVTNFRRHRYIE